MELIGSLRAIRALCEVDARGSFSAAADAVNLTQSAVSQHVNALERLVGMPLVERGTRPVGLTDAGHALVRHGRAVLARLETAEQELAEISGRRSSRLRFGSFPTALTTFVPAALARLRKASPGLTLTVVDDHMQRLLPRLVDRELDLALIYDQSVQDRPIAGASSHGPKALPGSADADLVRVHLLDDAYRVVLPRGHRLARRNTALQLTDLADEAWIGGSTNSAWFRIVRNACRASGFEPRAALGTDDYLAVQSFAAAGLGVAVIPGLAVAHPLPGVEVRALRSIAPTRRIWAVHMQDAFRSPALTSLIALLEAATRRYRLPPSTPPPPLP